MLLPSNWLGSVSPASPARCRFRRRGELKSQAVVRLPISKSYQSMDRSVGQSLISIQFISPSRKQSSINQSINQACNQGTNQSTGQAIKQSANLSVDLPPPPFLPPPSQKGSRTGCMVNSEIKKASNKWVHPLLSPCRLPPGLVAMTERLFIVYGGIRLRRC